MSSANVVPHCWSQLPEVIINEIFSHLSVFDRSAASLVCHNWSQGFNSPLLWRNATIFFLGIPHEIKNFEIDTNRRIPALHDRCALKFAARFGKYVKTLIVSYHPIYMCKSGFVKRKVEKFLKRLADTGCQLKELTVIGHMDPHYCSWHDKEGITNAFIEFLITQRELEFVDLRTFNRDLRPLQSVISSCGSTLARVNTQFIFHPGCVRYKEFRSLLSLLPNLQVMKLSFVSLNKAALKILIDHCPNLNAIEIKALRTVKLPTPQTSPEDWRQTTQIRPNLQVSVEATLPLYLSRVPIILSQYMPLVKLELKLTKPPIPQVNWDLQRVFQYIKNTFSETLVIFIYKDYVNADLDENLNQSIRNVISSCSKLAHLELRAGVSVDTVEEIFCLQENKQIDIEKLKIQSCSFRKDLDKLRTLLNSYRQILGMRDWKFAVPKL